MKKNAMKFLALIAIVGGLAMLKACKKDAGEQPALTLVSLKANDVDLNGATAPTNVPTAAVITAVFSTTVDNASASNTNITLTRDYDGSDVAKTVAVTGSTVTITPTGPFYAGDHYTLGLTANVKSSGGKFLAAADRGFGTVGVGLGSAPQSSSQVMYVQFDNSIVDLTGNATKASEQVAYTTDRFGVANAAAMFRGATANGNGDIVEFSGTKFINASTTISVWFKIDQADYEGSREVFGIAGNNGYFFELGSGGIDWIKLATDHKVIDGGAGDPVHYFGTAWTDYMNGSGGAPDGNQLLFNFSGAVSDVITTGTWHQMTMTYDATTSIKTVFIDGIKFMQADIDANTTEWEMKDLALNNKQDSGDAPDPLIDPKLALGYAASKINTNPGYLVYTDSQNSFKGGMDDFRIFSKALTDTEVLALFNAEKP